MTTYSVIFKLQDYLKSHHIIIKQDPQEEGGFLMSNFWHFSFQTFYGSLKSYCCVVYMMNKLPSERFPVNEQMPTGIVINADVILAALFPPSLIFCE